MSAASQAVLGYGSKFSVGSGQPITYADTAEITTINFGGFTVSDVDVTHLQSPGSVMESIPGLLKPGTIELTGNFTGDASQQAITTLGQNRTVFPWKITAPMQGSKVYNLSGSGYVSKLQKGPFDANKKTDFSVTIQVTGAFTETIV